MPGPIFDLSVEHDERGTALVRPRGELDMATAGRLEACLGDLTGAPVILDLTGLTFMDSTGVRLLLQTADEARRTRRRLRMVPPREGEALVTLRETGVAALLPFEDDGEP